MDLSIVILNWNTCALLEACLRSILCARHEIDLEVIVVDNASQDKSRKMVAESFPKARLIANPRNLGFGAGNNKAIPAAAGRYVLFLNSDTVVTEGALDNLVRYADSNTDIGVIGPKLLNGDGSLQYSCRRYPNLGTGFFRNTPLGRLFPKNRYTTDYLLKDWDHASARDVDWLSGAALMIRRTVLVELGGFDEDFYIYCEDVDLCWRVNHLARAEASADSGSSTWRVTYYPHSVIVHLIGKSSDKAPTRMTYEFHRSQYLFYIKHYAATTPFMVRPLIPLGIGARAIGQMTRYRMRYWRRRLLDAPRRGRRQPR